MKPAGSLTRGGLSADELVAHGYEMVALSHRLLGLLKDKEVRFLAMAAATMPPDLGEVLEIGSYRGLSTVILARSVRAAGGTRVVAVDPLTLPAATDFRPADAEDLPAIFRRNLVEQGVANEVEFHRMRSGELARTWKRPLRFLWIDGDHTGAGACADVKDFAPFLVPGGVIALHDVLHGFAGPVRAFAEGVLTQPWCGPCGVTGSIGWAQRLPEARAAAYAPHRERLRRRLARLLPFCRDGAPLRGLEKLHYKLLRSRVPHGNADPVAWSKEILENLASQAPTLATR